LKEKLFKLFFKFNLNFFFYVNNTYNILLYLNEIVGDWGLGIGDWGLGIGDWAQSPIPNPQSPIPIL